MHSNNPFKNTHVEFHILQSFPVTCLNRDDVGAPKTAIIGGSTRARVSSQCWKRPVRLAMQEFGIKLATRTKLIDALITKACLAEGATPIQAEAMGKLVSAELSGESDTEKGATLLFLSASEVNAFARKMKEFKFSFDELDAKIKAQKDELKALKAKQKKKEEFNAHDIKDKEAALKVIQTTRNISKMFTAGFSPGVDGLDIALFGRMVAKASTMNVEAAASFSHAISTHKVSNEVEFFTAIGDLSGEESGADHMGSLEFNSATYYRYISLDLGQLWQTLQGVAFTSAVEAFIKALFVAIPSARQTTQSGASPWDFAKVFIRKGQRLQVPFETAVRQKEGGFLQPSIAALKEYLEKKKKLAGSLFGAQAEYTWGEDENFSIDDLLVAVTGYIDNSLGAKQAVFQPSIPETVYE